MKLLTQNSKMKKTSQITGKKTFNFSLPAIKTCPFADECKKFCYANKGFFKMPSVTNKHHHNYRMSAGDDFTVDMVEEIIEGQIEAVRIHDTGDFYSAEYLNKWKEIALALPHVTFYAYTKSVRYFKHHKIPGHWKDMSLNKVLPLNMTIIFSYGGKDDHMIDDSFDRHAKVFNGGELPDNYVYGNTNDHVALARNHRIGLIKH